LLGRLSRKMDFVLFAVFSAYSVSLRFYCFSPKFIAEYAEYAEKI